MDVNRVKIVFGHIYQLIEENKDYLGELDGRSGDGDLGVSMAGGFAAVVKSLSEYEEKDLGKVFLLCSKSFNAAAPSSLGTILSLGMMGMAKTLKGKENCSVGELADAMEKGLMSIMDKAKSKPGDKTVLDALDPAVKALKQHENDEEEKALKAAAEAAKEGAESTVGMKSVHGRAAYYGEKSIGQVDGGAVVGKLIFQGIAK